MPTATFKPGQNLRCTVIKAPFTHKSVSTVTRLMRFDDDIKRRLKDASTYRMKTLYIRSRGGRPWEVRERSTKYAKPTLGTSWTIKYFPHIAPDLASVEQYIKIEAA